MNEQQIQSRPVLSPGILAALGFTALYLIGAVPYALLQGNNEFLFYIIVMLGLIAALGWVHYRVRLSAGVIWALSIWGLLHMSGGLLKIPDSWPREGDARVLYNLWLSPFGPKYDQVIHAYGFGIMTFVCWQGLQARFGSVGMRPNFGLLVVCVAAATGFGALNEVIEFAATLIISKTNVGGYENTGWDLVSNLVGAIIAAILIRLSHSGEEAS